VRAWLAAAISTSMKHSFAGGIGLFMVLIGLYETGLVTSFAAGMPPQALLDATGQKLRAPAAPLKIGDLASAQAMLAILAVLLMAALLARRVRGAILLGMAATAALGAALGLGSAPKAIVTLPFTGEYTLAGLALAMDVRGVLSIGMLPVLLTLFLMGFLDTLGTLVGLGASAGLLDEKGDLPEIEKPMLVDALSCMFAGAVGTTTSGAYIESATGIRDGARTGLAAVTTGLLFAASLFFVPLLLPLQQMRFVYAPALIVVGMLMAASLRKVDFDDVSETLPALATIAMMVFSYNIANGLTAGLLLYPLVKLLAGRVRDVGAGAWALAALCAVYYVFGLPH
jgi:AGZA family xanthine/uracil permease-like MFS transporter